MPNTKQSPKGKDLPPKKGGAVKGGKLSANENVTIVRLAR